MTDAASTFLRDAVLGFGVPVDVVDRAEQDGTLELLALEHSVSLEVPQYDLIEVAARSGIDSTQLRALWRALGFPDPRPGERVFTDTDVEMLSDVVRFIDAGALEADLALQMSRVIGSSLNRIATALVDAADSQVTARREAGESPEAAQMAAVQAADVLPLLPQIMEQVWRRHLGAAARRRIVRATADEGQIVCVGFADLVGFTAQTQELPEHQLAEVVGRFETIAFELTSAHGGRVVKMIGDEVMFTCDDVITGAELALDMAATYRQDDHLSDVRVGMASGRVLERDGDVFGSVVNLASRVTNVAFPGAVIVSQDMHDALEGDDRFVFRSLRSHYLKDIGRVPLWALRLAGDESKQPFQHERRRRSARKSFTLSYVARPVFDEVESVAPGALAGTERPTADGGPTTEQLEAISEAVLEADIDTELQVELLADIEASRRLQELEAEAHRRADLADLQAEKAVAEAEAEARRKVEEAESEARRRIEQALSEAERKTRRATADADRKVAQAEETAERKAKAAKRDARRKAERKAGRKNKKRSKDRDEDG
ncbi:MAG: adenylate/guanylate cyclase domain-containing protein [Acidimicrobiales bacterium]